MNLFNKYRPKTLDEIKGQDFVVSTLKNKIPHTLLFTSSLGGTGKTSTACILANELIKINIYIIQKYSLWICGKCFGGGGGG